MKKLNAMLPPLIALTTMGILATTPAHSQTPTDAQQRTIDEETARWQQVRECANNQSHSGNKRESKEKLPSGWEEVTADGQRVKIMAENGNDLYLELRCIIRSKGVNNMAYVAVDHAPGDHVLRFWCDSINHSRGRVFFDDVTSFETLNSGGREVSPNTLIGSIGFFACQHK
ncbi:MAG: hypothetical protein AB3X44_05825 [Leptothrix sp. (in: b-proteobacteria)]